MNRSIISDHDLNSGSLSYGRMERKKKFNGKRENNTKKLRNELISPHEAGFHSDNRITKFKMEVYLKLVIQITN